MNVEQFLYPFNSYLLYNPYPLIYTGPQGFNLWSLKTSFFSIFYNGCTNPVSNFNWHLLFFSFIDCRRSMLVVGKHYKINSNETFKVYSKIMYSNKTYNTNWLKSTLKSIKHYFRTDHNWTKNLFVK